MCMCCQPVCVCVRVCVCVCVCTCERVRKHGCVSVCLCACVRACVVSVCVWWCTCVCVHACVHVRTRYCASVSAVKVSARELSSACVVFYLACLVILNWYPTVCRQYLPLELREQWHCFTTACSHTKEPCKMTIVRNTQCRHNSIAQNSVKDLSNSSQISCYLRQG